LESRDRRPERSQQFIVNHLFSALENAGSSRAGRVPAAKLTAFEHYARRVAELALFTPEDGGQALEHFQKAIDADPQFGPCGSAVC
jgi:hypothetical protein